MDMTTELIDLELLSTSTNVERETRKLEFVLQQMQTALMALTSYEANDMVAKSRKDELASLDHFSGKVLCWNSKQGSNDLNSTCRATRKS